MGCGNIHWDVGAFFVLRVDNNRSEALLKAMDEVVDGLSKRFNGWLSLLDFAILCLALKSLFDLIDSISEDSSIDGTRFSPRPRIVTSLSRNSVIATEASPPGSLKRNQNDF
jgi:hypothetical protein